MEQLGLHELDEEDVALCEFVCTSKIPVQEMVRKGLDLLIEEEE
jgi:Na+-transporting NADH:ubiquinone oxidoreductase subunit A